MQPSIVVQVIIWDVENFRIIWDLVGHQHSVCKCSFSPDGALLATCSFDTCVIVWDVASGVSLQRLQFVSSSLFYLILKFLSLLAE